MKFSSTAILTALGLASSVAANIGKGVPDPNHPVHNLYKRHRDSGVYDKLINRRPHHRRANTEASQAAISSAKKECTAYSVPEVAALASQFPAPWANATILPSDTQAQAVWKSIQSSGIIPSGVQPKGTVNGDFSSFTPSYSRSDPDCWWTFNGCLTPKHTGIPADTYTCPEPNTWGLTFDDGPNCTHNAFYDFLQQKNQKATMFYIGSNVLDWPLEAQRGIVDGHHICVHTWSHQYMTAFPNEQVFAELYYTAKAIKDIVGVTPTCWRPPFGDVDDRVRAIATGLGLETIIWTDDTDDWKILPLGTLPTASIDANYASIIAKETQGASAGQGNIVLTHEINGHTMQEFIKQYSNIEAAFKYIVPLTACKNQTRPYPENIVYPNFADYIAGNVNATGLPDGTSIKASNAGYNANAAASYTKTAGTAAAATSAGSKSAQSAAVSAVSTAGNKAVQTAAAAKQSSAPSAAAPANALLLPTLASVALFAAVALLA